jgi:Cd2+/Zn2+-exporting ATPase/Cu+-exporting ATPase
MPSYTNQGANDFNHPGDREGHPQGEKHDESGDAHGHETNKGEYVRLGLMAAVILASIAGWWRSLMTRDWLAFAATLIGGWPIFEEAWENLRKRRMTMELSMTIALIAALCVGQFFTALVIAFFVLFAELVEGYTVGGGRRAIHNLIDSLPRKVTVRRAGQELQLGTEQIASGEVIIVRPGEKVPADGTVKKGHSFIDQSSITGEPLPVEKVVGSKVFAGTINKDGVLELQVERIGRDTTFGKIVEIVEQAEKSKAPVQRIADRLAAGLVYFALGAAGLTLLVTRNLTSTIAVIIVAGACGVAAGTPLAILAGIGSAARRGIIIKGGLYLEQLSQIDTVVLDKTGTLTLGLPEVTSVKAFNRATEDEVLQTAAIAEQHSEHPLGEAIVRCARQRNLPLREYANLEYVPGKGLACEDNGSEILVGSRALFEERGLSLPAELLPASATTDTAGQTIVLVGKDKQILGTVALADQLRAEAKQAVIDLKQEGYHIVLMTGDTSSSAKAMGEALSVHETMGDLLPHQKLERIRELLASGHKVVMVGDGVNDAPALAEATVGVAMGQGTDVALETADVTLMTSDLSRLVEVLMISRRCYRVIMFNFGGTILVDTIGIILAFCGLLAPIVAALIHIGSELAFILNSARLFRRTSTSKPGSASI